MADEEDSYRVKSAAIMIVSPGNDTLMFAGKLFYSGNSLRVTIPSQVRDYLNLEPNDYVQLTLTKLKDTVHRETKLTSKYE